MADASHQPPAIPPQQMPASTDASFADSMARLTTANMPITPTTPPPGPPPGGFPSSPAMPQAPLAMPQVQTYKVSEDALSILKKYDTVIIMDDSGSMWDDNRWEEAKQALSAFVEHASRYDTDGVDICFLNSSIRKNVKSPHDVGDLFTTVTPTGGTYIGERLDKLTREYLAKLKEARGEKKEKKSGFRSLFSSKSDEKAKAHKKVEFVKPINYIIITDGSPSDEPGDIIKRVAKKLDKKDYPASQLGIQFLQIGRDSSAKAYLEELDDDLHKSGIRDIVDTTPYDGSTLTWDTIAKVLLGGVNRRVDKKGGGSV